MYLFKDAYGLVSLGIGAFIGGVLQLGFAFLGLVGLNAVWQPKISFKNANFIKILRQLPARSLDQGIDAVNAIVETNRARLLGDGAVTAYANAFTLHNAPILLMSAISTAAFPKLTQRLAQNRPDLFKKDFFSVLRVLIWLTLPVVVIAYFCRAYLARLIFKRGSPEIALILGFLAVAILFRIIYSLLSRYFYAHKDTVTPLVVSVFAIALNIILVFTLAKPNIYDSAGLAIAQSIVAAAEVLVLGLVLWSRDNTFFDRAFLDDLL